jgi:protein SFI1
MEKKQKGNLSSGKIKKTHKNVKSKENLCVIGRGKIKTTPVSFGNPWKIQPPHAENPLERTIIITNPKILHPRSKYLMTKYGRKWLVKVYGRISPTRAREIYNGRLLHVILKRWDGVVWRDCHEWKLMIRAECHDRYRLWYMAWNKWRMFIKIRRDKNRKILLGQQLVSHNKMKCFFKYWKERVELNNLQQKHVIMADCYRDSVERKNLKMCLVKWYNDTINRQRDNSMADHQYNGQLIAKCYNHWMSEYDMKLTSRDFHCKRLMQKHFHIWMKYIEIRQLKTSAKNTAVMFDVRRLLAGHFDKWKFCNQRLHLMYQLQLKVDCTNQRLLLERAVSSWRSYVEYRHIKSDQLSVAIHHHTRLVKLKVLRIFQKYRDQQEISRCHSQTAASFDTARLMKWSWRVWLRRCEHNEDIKLHPLTKRGLHHYRIVAMTTHWKAWRRYMKYRRLQKYSNKCAVDHLRMKTLRKYFNLFKNNVQWSLYKKELCMKSLNFRKNVLLCQCFYHWWNKSITECRTRDHMTQV